MFVNYDVRLEVNCFPLPYYVETADLLQNLTLDSESKPIGVAEPAKKVLNCFPFQFHCFTFFFLVSELSKALE